MSRVSGATGVAMLNLSVGSVDAREALARFQDMRYRLVSKGIRASPLQPHWCAIRPGELISSRGEILFISGI